MDGFCDLYGSVYVIIEALKMDYVQFAQIL